MLGYLGNINIRGREIECGDIRSAVHMFTALINIGHFHYGRLLFIYYI